MKNDLEMNFISKLLHETYSKVDDLSLSASENTCEQLEDYFQTKTQDSKSSCKINSPVKTSILKTLQDLDVSVYESNFISEMGCFRFNIQNTYIDFPRTWSFFENIYLALTKKVKIFLTFVSESSDQELISILSQQFKDIDEIIVFLENEKCFLAFLKKENEIIKKELSELYKNFKN